MCGRASGISAPPPQSKGRMVWSGRGGGIVGAIKRERERERETETETETERERPARQEAAKRHTDQAAASVVTRSGVLGVQGSTGMRGCTVANRWPHHSASSHNRQEPSARARLPLWLCRRREREVYCVCVCMYVCMYVCVYIYIYMYIYIYLYTHILYIYIYTIHTHRY